MSEAIVANLKALSPDVINSYQGAFGPPTQGHYQAMLFSAREHLKRYPAGKIVMLFMPTAASSSKPHLKPTQAVRIESLNIYCQKLRDTFALEGILENRIVFLASELEYKLANEGKSTATINTIRALKGVGCDVTLTMGLDNMFDLPYWGEIEKYAGLLADPAIYVPRRDITAAEDAALLKPYGNEIRFAPHASFDKDRKKPWESLSEVIKSSLEILKDRIVLLDKPYPTSSTLLRCGLYALYGPANNEWNAEYVPYLRVLQGTEPRMGDPWHRFYGIANFYGRATPNAPGLIQTACTKEDAKDFKKNFTAAGLKVQSGGRRRRRGRGCSTRRRCSRVGRTRRSRRAA
jgi:nicotinic acid mononucleotide adenylyltransferase